MSEKILTQNNTEIIKCIPEKLLGSSVFFDIETTGFSPAYCSIFLSGLMTCTSEKLLINQYFCKSDNEADILYKTSGHFKNAKYIVTFNGGRFDIPFYIHRCTKYNIDPNIGNCINIDFYPVFRMKQNILSIESLSLKNIEKYLGINRKDELGGDDMVRLFHAYTKSPKKEYEELMILHNYEDILNMPLLFDIERNLSSFIIENELHEYLPVYICEKNISIKGNLMKIKAKTHSSEMLDYIHNGFDVKYFWNRRKGEIFFEIITEKIVSDMNIIIGYPCQNGILPLKNNNDYNMENISVLLKRVLEQ